jgi:hypothetical protein
MHLVDVKIVHFLRSIFDDPIFHIALMNHNIGNKRMGVKHCRRLPFNG